MYQADRINQPTLSRDSERRYRRRHRRSFLRRRNRPGNRLGQVLSSEHISMLFCQMSDLYISVPWLSPDGMDREEYYPDRSCPMANHHRGTAAGSHWENRCSSGSVCSGLSSDEETKPTGHSRGEQHPPGSDTREHPPAVVNLLPPSGPSAGTGPPVDLGGPPYSG